MIATLKNDTIELDDKTVQNYQYIMNHIADFSTKNNHDNIVESQVFAALETISLNNKDKAKKLAELLHDEIVNENALKKCIINCSL
jgi:hypothetical protein